MKVDPRTVLAHPVVMALEPEKRTVLLALLREASDPWGELTDEHALLTARRAIASVYRAKRALAALYTVRLLSRADDGIVCVWTPQQREDAYVFESAELDAATNSTDESEAL